MASGELSSALEDLAMAEAISPDLKVPAVDLTPEHRRSIRLRALELRSRIYPRRRLDSLLALAREHRNNGDIESARSVLSGYETHPEVSIQQARWAVEDGDASSAIAMLEPVLDRHALPRRVRAHAWSVMASARELIGDFDGATEAARHALQLDRHSIHAYVSLAALAERRGDHERALEYLRRAWGMNPSNTSLLTRIARVAERAGRGPDALLAMERAVQIDPSSPDLADGLVSLQLRQGRYSEAAVSLARALDRHPTNPQLLDLADRLRRDIGIR
jgi:tetratricopeptide (TPR) repeat protein